VQKNSTRREPNHAYKSGVWWLPVNLREQDIRPVLELGTSTDITLSL
jgi:hypothetical protein